MVYYGDNKKKWPTINAFYVQVIKAINGKRGVCGGGGGWK